MTVQMPQVECPHAGCGHYGEPVRGKWAATRRGVWLCESCGGPLPIKTPRQHRARRNWQED